MVQDINLTILTVSNHNLLSIDGTRFSNDFLIRLVVYFVVGIFRAVVPTEFVLFV